jgi:hypothetical protein
MNLIRKLIAWLKSLRKPTATPQSGGPIWRPDK